MVLLDRSCPFLLLICDGAPIDEVLKQRLDLVSFNVAFVRFATFWEVGNATSVWCVRFDAWNDTNLIITVLRVPYFSRDASGSDVLTWIDHGPLKWLIKSTNEMKSLMGNYALQNWCGCVSFIENASLIGTNLFISFKTCWSGNDTAWRVWRWSRIEVDDCLSHSALW